MRSRLAFGFVLATSVLGLLGCGARTSLFEPEVDSGPRPPPDAGPDAGFDGGPPAELVVDCGRSEQFTTPRRPITLEATAESPDAVTFQEWELVTSPPGSAPTLSPEPIPSRITLTPDMLGEYLMRFTARDGAGRTASCEVLVSARVGPPVALCPEGMLQTVLDVPLLIMGDGFDDDFVVSFFWELVSSPRGAIPRLSGVEAPVVEFTGDRRGTYVLRLTVVDPDMASDSCEVSVLVTGPPEVECPPSPLEAPTRVPVAIEARVMDDLGIASERWEILAQPAGSTASPMPPDMSRTSLTPDRQGRYQLRFTATDVEGLSASCEVTVIGRPTPPTVTCPAVVTTTPLTRTDIAASAVDDGRITRWQWELSMRPTGSAASPPSPRDAAMTVFRPDIAGVYELTVTVFDDDGMSAMCTTRVEAGNVDGLRVEIFWTTRGTDMDTHLMNPTGTRWTSTDDCYYGNCNTSGTGGMSILEWGAPGEADNPRLDLDDTDGLGPENINITTPVPGTYRIAIHNYSGSGPNPTTVRIYCGGSVTMPERTFGPVSLRAGRRGNDFWRVADVEITATGCRVVDLSRGGTPWIEPHGSTIGMR